MRVRTQLSSSILLISLALSGCNSLPTGIAETDVDTFTESTEAFKTPLKTSVLESLVSGAARLSEEQKLENSAAEGTETAAAAITTTIPMTPNRLVERAINDFLQNRRSMLQVWAARSQTYFPMIEQIFAQEDVPDELKYLALGESGLNPTIRSSAGAVGMWQFMPATARGEGLRVDSWVDERRDPEKATRAAAQHFKALNESYNGRWHLTVAGYNCSYRCISRAARKSGYSMDELPSYWDVYLNLPKETRDFVPRFIATALLISNPEMYGIEVEDLGQELAYDVVLVQGMLSLEDAARMAGTDVPTIHKLNPSLLRPFLPDDAEPYALKIPLESYEHFVSAFTAAEPQSMTANSEYIVQSGDTLGKIAKRFDTTVEDLQYVNGIKSHLINIKQKLQIPGKGGLSKVALVSTSREFVAYGSAMRRPIELAKEFQLVHQSGSTPDAPLLAVSLNQNMQEADEGMLSLVPTIYQVRSGDTLGDIAKRFGVSVASIQQGNNLNGTMIFPKQELTIHSATNIVDAPAAGAAMYQVQNGDSLYQIARRFGMTVASLKQLNGLNSNLIRPGQNLLIN